MLSKPVVQILTNEAGESVGVECEKGPYDLTPEQEKEVAEGAKLTDVSLIHSFCLGVLFAVQSTVCLMWCGASGALTSLSQLPVDTYNRTYTHSQSQLCAILSVVCPSI